MDSNDKGKRTAPRANHLTSFAAPKKSFTDRPEAKDVIKERKERFEGLNREITQLGGWIVSIPGAREVRFQVLPGNPLPDHLQAAGYDVYPEGTAERILPTSKIEWLVKGSDGSFEPMTEGSTKTPAARVSHAGVHRVEVYSFDLNSQKR